MDIKEYPAPWKLNGKGYILLYKFSKNEIKNFPFIDDEVKNNFKGGFGTIMIVDYFNSNAGPYGELLFIPGKFHLKFNFQNNSKNKLLKKRIIKYRINKIYVSTIESVNNGIKNWQIPKEIANFYFKKEENNKKEIIEIKKDNDIILKAKIKSYILKFPVNTKILPFPLAQRNEYKIYFTNFRGKGLGSFAKIEELYINEKYFPDISYKNPLLVIKVEPFEIIFPEAKIIELTWKSN